MKRERYQVLVAGEWMDVSKGAIQSSGWLHWQTMQNGEADEVGLTPPGKWRVKPAKVPKVKSERG